MCVCVSFLFYEELIRIIIIIIIIEEGSESEERKLRLSSGFANSGPRSGGNIWKQTTLEQTNRTTT